MQRRHFLATSAVALGSVSTSIRAANPNWPHQAIKWVIPFPAGSSPDLIGRLIAEPLAKALGQPVVVDNKPGAGGNIGTGLVAKATPDGYTFLFTIQGPLVTAPLLSKACPMTPRVTWHRCRSWPPRRMCWWWTLLWV